MLCVLINGLKFSSFAAATAGPGDSLSESTASPCHPRVYWKSNRQTLEGSYSIRGSKTNSMFSIQFQPENGRVAAAAAAAQLAGKRVLCDCGLVTLQPVSKTAKNPNRRFMVCRKPQGDASKCDFFVWCDEVAAYKATLQQQQQQQHR